MWHTFNYKDGVFYIATKAWSDFAAHIPLIRSFSWGKNFPPEYPIFSGEPIRYHFLFYAFVGFLEKLSLPIDWALNIPSIFSFTFLLVAIFYFAYFLFKNKLVSLLSVLFFLFNSSLSFVYFFKDRQIFSLKIFSEIISNQTFPAFAPYDKSLISGGFWNLNVFTNQRHFALPLVILLTLVLLVLQDIKKHRLSWLKAFLYGLVIGLLPFLHGGVFIMALAVFGSIFLLFGQRKKVAYLLLIAFFVSLPQIAYLKSGQTSGGIKLTPGYLVFRYLTPFTFLRYWFLNLGLGFFLIPLGLLLSSRFAKKTFLAFCSVFMVGNLFQFGPDIATNHKFFNLWIIIGNMFIAYALYSIWKRSRRIKIFIPALILFLTLSGVIDFFAIKNDASATVADIQKNPDIAWIKNNTARDAVFLNSSYLYHPANLAGRKIFLGWPYFPWSAGYDTNKRETSRKKILGATTANKKVVCEDLKINGILFVSLGKKDTQEFKPNFLFWENNFVRIYNNSLSGLVIYDVNKSCL